MSGLNTSDNAEQSADKEAPAAADIADLPESARAACARAGWQNLTPVQSLALPALFAGKDMMIQSRTGSGKTACYLLPLLEGVDAAVKSPQALVLAPTRELARQIEAEAAMLFGESGIKARAIYGGVGYKSQLEALREGVQVVIGTPGRIMDYLGGKKLDLAALRFLVFDEADRMLSIGFYPDICAICRHVPARRQTTLFSATYPPHVLRLAREFMREPRMLSLSAKSVHVAETEHLFCEVKPMEKDRVLARLLETENPSSAIIFCNTRANTSYVAGVLKGFGYSAAELSSDLSQKKRESVLAGLRSGQTRFLVATDLAARGIDIPELSHVFLYEPPEDMESYIHRAGRTGRAGAAGTVISLVDVMQRLELERIGRFYRINLRQIPAPSDEDAAASAAARLSAALESELRTLNGLERLRMARYLPLAREVLSGGMDEYNLDRMAFLLDKFHRQVESPTPPLQAPPQSRGPGKKRGRRSGGRRKNAAKSAEPAD